MNLHLLRMFVAVVDQHGFSRAAEVLHVSQSAVSKGVRELEHQLGLPLIDDRRGIGLTEAGEALLPHARSLFALERVAAEEIDDRVRLRRGRLRIGASTTVAGYWLPGAIASLLQFYPGIAVELVVGNTGEIARSVADCTTDIGFVEGWVELPALSCTPWRDDPMLLVVGLSPALDPLPASADALARCTWLLRERGSGTRQVTEAFLATHGIRPERLVELGSNEAIVRVLAEGTGVAMLPRCVVRDQLAAGRACELELDWAPTTSRPLYRLEFKGRARTPALDAFLALPGVSTVAE